VHDSGVLPSARRSSGRRTSGTRARASISGRIPPDGYNSAILDGGNNTGNGCQRTDFLDIGFYLGGASKITVDGLLLQHFTFGGFLVHGGHSYFGTWVPTGGQGEGASDSDLIENNVVQHIPNMKNGVPVTNGCPTAAPYTGFPNGVNTDLGTGGLLYGFGQITNLTITHNVGIDFMMTAIDLEVGDPGDTFSGLSVDHNFIYDAGKAAWDNGAMHLFLSLGANDAAPCVGCTFSYNYLRDCGGNSGQLVNTRCIYMDDETSGVTLTGNVMAGHYTNAAFIAHGGHDNTWQGNIIDLGDGALGLQSLGQYQNSPHCTGGASCMTNNLWSNNIVVANNAIANAGGYVVFSPDAPLVARDDLDHEYGSGSIVDSASVSASDPNFTCGWTYALPANSPAYQAPVSFPAQPSGWGALGFWGPPGYPVPRVGTPPSPPHGC
jgi:hypothetical protein